MSPSVLSLLECWNAPVHLGGIWEYLLLCIVFFCRFVDMFCLHFGSTEMFPDLVANWVPEVVRSIFILKGKGPTHLLVLIQLI